MAVGRNDVQPIKKPVSLIPEVCSRKLDDDEDLRRPI